MPVRPVIRLPEEVLTRSARPCGPVDEQLAALGEDLIDTMRVSPGCVGLAAPQLGVGLRAFVVDVTGHRKARSCHGTVVMFDPVLISYSGAELAREGCMSVPDLTGDVPRPTSVVVRGAGLDGTMIEIEADAFEARAFLHELDHLDGKLFLDRVPGPSAVFQRRVYR
ncbi:MAG: peptide deformylase [Acidimicrobiales bacterium]